MMLRTSWISSALCVLACVGCSTTPERTGGVRAVSELPPEYRDLWLAWLSSSEDWPQRRAAALAEPRQTAFLVDNLAREMLRGYGRSEITDPDSETLGTFERAQAELVRLGERSVPTLIELLAIGNGATAFLTGDLLVQIGRPAVPAATGLLERDEERARRRAAELLGRLPHALDGEPQVRAALAERLAQDPEWIVRRESARALALRGSSDVTTEPVRRTLTGALTDQDVEVRRAALEGLALLDDPAAMPALINALERAERDADIATFNTCLEALSRLSGGARARNTRGWRTWWRANRPDPKKATGSGNQPPRTPTIRRP